MHPFFQEIIEKCSRLNIIDKRNISEDSCDLVFSIEDRDELRKIFGSYFGEPLKHTDDHPSWHHKWLARKFGGIRTSQKLYAVKVGDLTVIALFMPWLRGINMTVRLGIVKDDVIKSRTHYILCIMKEFLISLYRSIAGRN